MKKILSIVGALAIVAGAHGQGYLITLGGSAAVKTNNVSGLAPGAQTSGNTVTAAGQFYYALLFTSSTNGWTSVSPTNSLWSMVTPFAGGTLSISNYNLLAGGINGSGGNGGVQVNMAAATAYNVELVGWSANLGGQNAFSTVIGYLANGNWATPGYFGYTTVGTMTPFATAGAGDPSIFPATWANNTLVLYSVAAAGPVPEPSTMALAALGGASLLLFRRRK